MVKIGNLNPTKVVLEAAGDLGFCNFFTFGCVVRVGGGGMRWGSVAGKSCGVW